LCATNNACFGRVHDEDIWASDEEVDSPPRRPDEAKVLKGAAVKSGIGARKRMKDEAGKLEYVVQILFQVRSLFLSGVYSLGRSTWYILRMFGKPVTDLL
jgi:hypothetical protein